MYYSVEHDRLLRRLRDSLGPQWKNVTQCFNLAFSKEDDLVYTQAMLRNRYARVVKCTSFKKRCRNCGEFMRGHSCRSKYDELFQRSFCPLVDDDGARDDGTDDGTQDGTQDGDGSAQDGDGAQDDEADDSAPELLSDWEEPNEPTTEPSLSTANAPLWPYDAVECAQDFMASMMHDYEEKMRYRSPQFGDLRDDTHGDEPE